MSEKLKQKIKILSKISALLGAVILVFAISTSFSHAATGINKQINFQGKIVNIDGTNVTDNTSPGYSFTFSIYDADSGGTLKWTETKNIPVRDGIFQTNLGTGTTFPGSVDFNTDNIYLGIEFNSNGEMTPRIRFTAAPYAFNADNLDGKDWGVPGAIGSTTPNSASFTTLNSSGSMNLASTAGSGVSIGNTTGTAIINSGGTSSWANTSGSLTLSTVSSGTFALTSAGALNLSAASASTVTLANVANALNFDSDTLTIDALGNRIGIGTTNPLQKLSINGTLGIAGTTTPYYTIFQGGAQGGNITYTLPTTTPVASGYALVSTTDGLLSWAAAAGGYSTIQEDGNPLTQRSTVNFTGTAITCSDAGGITVCDVTGSGAIGIGTTISSATSGSILFAGTSGVLQQDNDNFFWDNSLKRLGIGTTAPAYGLQVAGSLGIGGTAYFASNVGIGTTNPLAPLHVNGNLFVESANGRVWGINGLTTGHTVYFQYGGDASNRIENTFGANAIFRAYHGTVFSDNAGEIARFGTSSASLNSYFNGSVGIGMTNPTYNLDITGTFHLSTSAPVFGTFIVNVPSSGTLAFGTGVAGYNGYWLNANTLASEQYTAVSRGGSGTGSFTAYSLVAAGISSTAPFQSVTAGSTGQLLTSGNGAAMPTWTTATYPSSTTANQLLYSSANNVVGGLTSLGSAVLVTTAGSAPQFVAIGTDTFTQYALLLGRAGGQTLIGGTAANDDLTLEGTSSGTKTTSYVILQPTAGSVGIGTTVPDAPLHIYTNANSGSIMHFQNANAGSSAYAGIKLTTDGGDSYFYRTSNAYGMGIPDSTVFQDASGGNMFFMGAQENMMIKYSGGVGINTTAPGQKLSVNGTFGISSSSAPFYTIFQGGTQPGNITYTLPTTTPVASGYALVSTTGGVLSWAQAGVTNHAALTGLSDDDHSIYALLAGRGAGQTLYGGTNPSANLTLVSTSSGTKGKILFGTSGYDEVNNRLGIGTTNPTQLLFLTSLATTGTNIDISNTSAGGINWLMASNGSGATYGPAGSLSLRDDTDNLNAFTILKSSGNVGIGTTNPTQGILTVSGGNIAVLGQGDMLFYDSDNTNYFGFQAATNTTSNTVYTLPAAVPGSDGWRLTTSATGILNWEAPGANGTAPSIGGAVSGGTPGSVLFVGAGNVLAQDNANFFWDQSNMRLGLGTTAPTAFLQVNETGTDALMRLQKSGVDKVVVSNAGEVTVNGSTANYSKNSTGNVNNPTDFQYTGGVGGTTSPLYNVSATQNSVSINDGAIAFDTSPAGSPTASTSAAVGAGSHSIIRDDGKIVIFTGGGATTASLWNGSSSTMTGTATTVPALSSGAISLKRPDGRYLVIVGGGSSAPSVFDPWGITPALAGPTLTGCAAGAGTNAFLRPDGKYHILCGTIAGGINGTYDPTANTWAAVAAPAGAPAFGAGAHAIQRDDGTFLVFYGGGSSTHAIFNANSNTWSGTNPIASGAPTVNTGATSVRRQDGKFLIIPNAQATSTTYDPVPTTANPYGTFTSNSGTGLGPTAALQDAAQLMWQQDGKYLLMLGGGTAVNIVDPSLPSFTTSPQYNLPAALGAGGHLVARPDGKYQVIRGGAATATDTLNFGFVMGGMVGAGTSAISTTGPQLAAWESECINIGDLNGTSTLNWNANQEGYLNFQIRTGTSCPLSTTDYKDIVNSGDRISPTTGDTFAQIRVFFKRDFPEPVDQDWKMSRGLSQVRYRRRTMDPMLYDVTINNSSLFHRTVFDLGAGVNNASSMDASGPASSNVNVAANGSLQLSMGMGNNALASGTNPVGTAYLGAYGSHTTLNTTAAEGSMAMKRLNGTYMILVGTTNAPSVAGAAVAEIYDPSTQTFTNNATAATSGSYGVVCNSTVGLGFNCAPNMDGGTAVAVGRGSLAFKRPDGKFLVIPGQGGTTGGFSGNTAPQSSLTNIYDPLTSTFSTGPNLVGLGGGGTQPYVGRGSQAIPLPNGNVLIIHGNYSTFSSIYNPVQNTMIAGPRLPVAIGAGALVIPRADGAWLLIPGTATECAAGGTTTYVFDPYAMNFLTNTGVVLTNSGTGPGALTLQRSDGTWLIIKGGGLAGCVTTLVASSTAIYNPFSNKLAVGPSLATTTSYGTNAMQRPDGSWLITNGNNVLTTQVYVEKDGIMGAGVPIGSFGATAGISTLSAPGTGSFNFQRDDGKYVQIAGMVGATGSLAGGSQPGPGSVSAVVMQYDAGWVMRGFYRAEQMSIPGLDSTSTLSWKTPTASMKGISAEARIATSQTALQTASTADVQNGGIMNPLGVNGSWVQVNFNFKRSVPSKEGIWSDVWMGGTSVKNQTWRVFDNPTLSEFKINKDKNLLDLQADGLSLFRVSSSGDIFTSANGSFRTGGADLAENYSSVEPLEKGEVVAIDPITDHSVKKALYQNQPDVLGVVSSDPGFVAGSYTEDSYPIALVGRVPVKVSTENGNIRAGDYLTAASVPGHAMRATKSGRVIGKALESLTPEKMTECPPDGYPMEGRKCGTIMMFVNLTDYSGMPVETLMAEMKSGEGLATATTNGDPEESLTVIPSAGNTSSANSASFSDYSKQAEILDFLKKMREEESHNLNPSEILTGRLSADQEIISPQIFTDLLVAKRIKADSIEGLEFIQTGIATAQDGMEVANTQIRNVGTELDALKKQLAELMTGKESAAADPSALVLTKLSALETDGGIIVGGPAEFKGPAVFRAMAEFIDKTIFRNDVEFAGKVMYNKDTAGYAVVKENAQDVEVAFEQEYAVPPIVNATLSLQTIEDPEVRAAAEQLLLVSDVKYIITNVTTKGFTIKIDSQAISDIPFAWQAIAVKNAKTFESHMTAADQKASPLEIAPIDTSINTAPGETIPVVGNSETAPPEQAQSEVVGTNNAPTSAVAGAENSAGNLQP